MTDKPKVGRPRKDPTVVLHYRVPESKANAIDNRLRWILQKSFNITTNKKEMKPRTYTAELASGFILTITAKNLTEAKALADRNARGNDKVISVKWDRGK